ncbi:MAG: DUF3467 domain-containing protein [Candidatus Omnitrophica bacterium]|nr:DUF3467 domain-containing protein [Candidatus Omnitrophota bacterium]
MAADPTKKNDHPEPKINWDDSQMRSSYANVCNVTGTREEIVLLFGTHENWHADQKEVNVKLSERIILNPFAAKRMLLLLNRAVKQYEERIGPINIDTQPPEKLA